MTFETQNEYLFQ